MDKVVVVTGASSGIGYALSKELHAKGLNLLLVARRQDRLKSLAAELNSIRAESAIVRVCDLSNREQSSELSAELAGLKVAGLVNNAGVGSLGAFFKLNLENELKQVELNVVSPMVLSRAVLPGMIERKEGFIINVSSIMAYQTVPFVATYCASKSFEWLHSVALSREVEDYGVRVLTLCPGPTETEFFGVAKAPGVLKTFKRVSAESVAKACLRDLEAGKRICIPNWQARALVFLAQFSPAVFYTWAVKKILHSRLPPAFFEA